MQAIWAYEELLAVCDSYDHPIEFAALTNSLDQVLVFVPMAVTTVVS